ncbi:alpha/beta fold hydrolase [Collinsella vaginalis]|uniref:alpha/beta fold hydrolase n=1 Tax=Collinsella vaginalis TaxID=1870987 RepID=UPI000A270D80|nr:alpha/beta fold hydrolase [Collinsella vaginalis]
MSLRARYYLTGLYVEDHSVSVPLDWRGIEPAELAANPSLRSHEPAIPGAPETISLFYRVVCAPENINRDLPLLIFLQGGPGGAGPRLTSPTSDGWIEEAVRHFRVILPDQRGCGRSSRVSRHMTERIPGARAQADYLKRHLARSIVKDFEYLRLTAFEGRPWVTLGQSYGGFLTLTYLSFYAEGVAASFTCGGIPHVPASAAEVYAHTFPRMAEKTRQFYARYPEDEERVRALADRLSARDVSLADGSPMSVRRLQLMGSDFGMKPSFERMHNILDTAFEEGDGTPAGDTPTVTDAFLAAALERTSSAASPLYWTLQELIYADGELEHPIRWAAARELSQRPEFAAGARPLMFTGEASFPWLFEEDPVLRPLKPAMDLLMEDTAFDRLYDPTALATNETPHTSAVYFDDLYVDAGLQLDTLSRIGCSHAWVTNEFEHDGLHGTTVFRHLFEDARDRGALAAIF